jgi:DNA-binding PadR family transcriptional regulator
MLPVLTRLLVLWLLTEGPLHGYAVRRALADPGLGFWFRVEDASIYSVLRTLVRRGLARVAGSERRGRRPERTRFEVTAAGRTHYRALLREALRVPRPAADPLLVALAAEGDLDEAEVVRLLGERTAALRARRARLATLARAAPSRALVERERALLGTEIRWLERETRSRRRAANGRKDRCRRPRPRRSS